MEALTDSPASELDVLTHVTLPSTTISAFDYAPDPVGNRDTLTETRPTFTITNGLNDYGYDLVNRLTSAIHPTLPTENYTYDPVGNRHPSTWQYNLANQLTNDGTFSYTYDANGNQLTKTDTSTSQVVATYTYSPENQLIAATTPTMTATYRYDGLGRRIQKDVNGVQTRYVYDQEDLLLEFTGTNVLQARWLHGAGIDEPLQMERDTDSNGAFSATERFTYHADGLGSIMELTDSTGTVIRSYYYDAFGQIANQTGTLVNPYTYTGREYDAETGTYHNRWRTLDPLTGRFLQEDPIGFEGGVNFYEYAANNPVNATDPFGLYGTNSCEYYKKRCSEAGGVYYCVQAEFFCNQFPKYADPNPKKDDDFEGWSRCVRQCLQECDSKFIDDTCSIGHKPDPKTDEFTDWQHTKCHLLCYTTCGVKQNPKF